MATIHHLRRGGSVRPIPNLRSVTRDSGAAYLPPVEVEGDKVWREFEAHCRRFDGPPRQYRIEPRIGFDPPINWIDLTAKAIIVAGLGVAVAMWTVLS